jgi:hypothetical protein
MLRKLGIYRLVPRADGASEQWDLAPNQGIVLVRAFSPADARVVAAACEADFPDVHAKPGDGITTAPASAFRDSGLYAVQEEAYAPYPAEGERGVVQGDLRRDVIRPLEG